MKKRQLAGLFLTSAPILGDSGAVSGAEKSLNEREINSGKEKRRTRRKDSGEKVLMDQFQTVGLVLASDWC